MINKRETWSLGLGFPLGMHSILEWNGQSEQKERKGKSGVRGREDGRKMGRNRNSVEFVCVPCKGVKDEASGTGKESAISLLLPFKENTKTTHKTLSSRGK